MADDCQQAAHRVGIGASTEDGIRSVSALLADALDVAAFGPPSLANLAGVRRTANDLFPVGTCRPCLVEALVVLAAVAAQLPATGDRAGVAAQMRRDMLNRAASAADTA